MATEKYLYAFLNKDNVVTDVVVFDTHETEALDAIKKLLNAYSYVFDATKKAGVGNTWDGTFFKPEPDFPSWVWNESEHYWEPPTPMPQDNVYKWDEDTTSWVFDEESWMIIETEIQELLANGVPAPTYPDHLTPEEIERGETA